MDSQPALYPDRNTHSCRNAGLGIGSGRFLARVCWIEQSQLTSQGQVFQNECLAGQEEILSLLTLIDGLSIANQLVLC